MPQSSFLRRSVGLALALSLPAAAVLGQQASDERFTLGTIQVIDVAATRQSGWSTPFQATLQAVELRRFERNDVASALSLLPGVSVQNLGQRSEKLVNVRGFNSRQVPLSSTACRSMCPMTATST